MRVLLDTCVLSELSRQGCHPAVRDQVATLRESDIYLSVISLGEIARGVALLDSGAKKLKYTKFLRTLEQDYGDRLLGIDAETAELWGEVSAAARKKGSHLGLADGLIAATALCHGLAVMTRNTKDFSPSGARLINPWGSE